MNMYTEKILLWSVNNYELRDFHTARCTLVAACISRLGDLGAWHNAFVMNTCLPVHQLPSIVYAFHFKQFSPRKKPNDLNTLDK